MKEKSLCIVCNTCNVVTSEVPSGKLDIFKESHIQSKRVLDTTHWIHTAVQKFHPLIQDIL